MKLLGYMQGYAWDFLGQIAGNMQVIGEMLAPTQGVTLVKALAQVVPVIREVEKIPALVQQHTRVLEQVQQPLPVAVPTGWTAYSPSGVVAQGVPQKMAQPKVQGGSLWQGNIAIVQMPSIPQGAVEKAGVLQTEIERERLVNQEPAYQLAWLGRTTIVEKAGTDFVQLAAPHMVNNALTTGAYGVLLEQQQGSSSVLLQNSQGAVQGSGHTFITQDQGAPKDLQVLRSLASGDTVNRFAKAEIQVDMSHMQNSMSSDYDVDSLLHTLTEKLEQALTVSAAGVLG